MTKEKAAYPWQAAEKVEKGLGAAG